MKTSSQYTIKLLELYTSMLTILYKPGNYENKYGSSMAQAQISGGGGWSEDGSKTNGVGSSTWTLSPTTDSMFPSGSVTMSASVSISEIALLQK